MSQGQVNPLECLTQTELQRAISAFDDRRLTFIWAATDLLAEDEEADDVLDYHAHKDLLAIVEDDTVRGKTEGENLPALERSITRLSHVRSKVFFTLEELGRKDPPYEQDVLNLAPADLQRAFDYYHTTAWELRVQLAQVIDTLEVADGHPSKADPLEWRAAGDLGDLINESNYFYHQTERHMSIGWLEQIIALKVRLEDALIGLGAGQGAN